MPETIVEIKPRPRDRMWIRLSGGRFFTIPQAEGEALGPGLVLGDEDIERLSRVDQYLRGRDKALRLLSGRARSRHELDSALAGMEISPGVRRGILEELRDLGLVDDARFAREYAGVRIDVKRLGPHRLRFELGKFGVSSAIVDRVLEESFPTGRQDELAREIVSKRLGSKTPDEGDVRRLSDFLKRKGFDYGVINRIAYELLRRRRGSFDTASDEESFGQDDE